MNAPLRHDIDDTDQVRPHVRLCHLVLREALAAHLDAIARYPLTLGLPELRRSIAAWLGRRHGVTVDSDREVIPVLGTREALFAIAQAVLDPADSDALVACPNPFYQIYEGAALLGGARPHFVNALGAQPPDWGAMPASAWSRVRLLYACSPGNPSGRVMRLDEWKRLFELSDRHGFVIVSDECYGELYFDEAKPPLGAGWPADAAAASSGQAIGPPAFFIASAGGRAGSHSRPTKRMPLTSADASDATKYSPSTTPSSTGEPLRATTSLSGSSSEIAQRP